MKNMNRIGQIFFKLQVTMLCVMALMAPSCQNENSHETQHNSVVEASNVSASSTIISKDAPIEKGLEIYSRTCIACHQKEGVGIAGAFPPLADSDYLMADRTRAIKQVIAGSEGEITVNGEIYNGIMPPQKLNDDEIAAVLTYAMNSWGNTAEKITTEEVRVVRGSL